MKKTGYSNVAFNVRKPRCMCISALKHSHADTLDRSTLAK